MQSERLFIFIAGRQIRREVRAALLGQAFLHRDQVVLPDHLPQVVEEFENGLCLLRRPVVGQEEGDAALPARGQLPGFHERFCQDAHLRTSVSGTQASGHSGTATPDTDAAERVDGKRLAGVEHKTRVRSDRKEIQLEVMAICIRAKLIWNWVGFGSPRIRIVPVQTQPTKLVVVAG
jgi:hypothetical protein